MAKRIIFLVLFVLLITLIEVIGIPYETLSNGSHTGIITAIETSGIIFKTTTVYVKTDAQSSQEDKYCLIDKSLIPKLEQHEFAKEQVTIYFKNNLVKGYLNCDSEPGGIIIGVSE